MCRSCTIRPEGHRGSERSWVCITSISVCVDICHPGSTRGRSWAPGIIVDAIAVTGPSCVWPERHNGEDQSPIHVRGNRSSRTRAYAIVERRRRCCKETVEAPRPGSRRRLPMRH